MAALMACSRNMGRILTCVGFPDHLQLCRPERNADILGLGINEVSSGSILGFFTKSLDDLEVELLHSFLFRDLLMETCSGWAPLLLETATALATKECWCGLEEVEGSVGCRSPRWEDRQLCSIRVEPSSSSEL